MCIEMAQPNKKTFEDYAIKRAQKCSLQSSKEIDELKKLLSNMTYINLKFFIVMVKNALTLECVS